VTPQSLGVAIAGGYARKLIPKNTTVPTSTTEVFTTSKDLQTTVKIMVLQGESEIARDNELLGEFVLSGLREATRGEVEIEVTFEINSEGIVSASAKDKETGMRQSITVTASGGLTREELGEILEKQADDLIDSPEDEELAQRRRELSEAMRNVRGFLPKVKAAMDGSDFAKDAVRRGEQGLTRAEEVLCGKSISALVATTDQLTRTLSVFKGWLQKIGSPEQ